MALKTPPTDDPKVYHSTASDASSTTLLPWAVTANGAQATPTTELLMHKRRAIFTDDDVAEPELSAQMVSVDATAVAVETTMQPAAGDGIVPRVVVGERERAPFRARRVLNLMDRLEAESRCTAVDGATVTMATVSEDAVAVDHREEERELNEDSLAIRRKWKRRLTETSGGGAATGPSLFLSTPPSTDRRLGISRAHSSHSVFLAPPKMSFARSTASREADGGDFIEAPKLHELVLPTVRSKSHPDLNVIAPHTVAGLFSGVYADRLDSYSLIDCRFGYEFNGGSLKGALSMNDPTQVEDQFLRKPPKNSTRTALIFYCEFSANRAPKMLRHIRNLDRWIHAERYPDLFYPELYLIDGGYKNCFQTLKDAICHPGQYQTMSDKAFVDQCKRDFATHRANWKRHKSNGCASKFQQLHRHTHDVFGDDSSSGRAHHSEEEELLAHPVNLRSFSQQL